MRERSPRVTKRVVQVEDVQFYDSMNSGKSATISTARVLMVEGRIGFDCGK